MALGVDLFGLDTAGTITWRYMCRWWNGDQLLDILDGRLKPAEPAPSWECILATSELLALLERFDKPELRSLYPNDADLAALLQEPGTDRVMLRIEEWGYG